MHPRPRYVADTNLLISRLLLPPSTPARAVQKAVERGDLLFSDATLEELAEVLSRPKFEKYLSRQERSEFFRLLSTISLRIPVTRVVTACRDPKDNKFLALALEGNAQAVITGDRDLLTLHPFLGIPILTPAGFLHEN